MLTLVHLLNSAVDGENFYVLKSLRHDKSIILTKPDKGVGLMVIDYNVYTKMITIVGDAETFIQLI